MEQGDSCDGVTAIRIYVTATDDRTSDYDMGYELTLVSGSFPSRFGSLPATSVEGYGGVLYLSGGSLDDYSFVLGVRAVDKAGNRGPITEIEVSHGSGGCVLGSRAASNGALWMAVLGWLLVRRRVVALYRRG